MKKVIIVLGCLIAVGAYAYTGINKIEFANGSTTYTNTDNFIKILTEVQVQNDVARSVTGSLIVVSGDYTNVLVSAVVSNTVTPLQWQNDFGVVVLPNDKVTITLGGNTNPINRVLRYKVGE